MALVVWAAVLEAAAAAARRAGARAAGARRAAAPGGVGAGGAVLVLGGVEGELAAADRCYAALAAIAPAPVGADRLRGHRRPAVLAALHEQLGGGPRPPAAAVAAALRDAGVLRPTSSSCRCWPAAVIGFALAVLVAPRRAAVPLALLVAGIVTFVLIGIAGRVGDRALPRRRRASRCSCSPASRSAASRCCERGRLRTAWWRRRPRWCVFGVVFTAIAPRPQPLRRRAELPRRRPRRPRARARRPAGHRQALRCGPLTLPNHKLVPDSRWIPDLPASRVIAARRRRAPEAAQGRRDRTSRAASRSSSTRGATTRRLAADPGAAARLAKRIVTSDFYAAYATC